jgi:putative NADH-flavin reductase
MRMPEQPEVSNRTDLPYVTKSKEIILIINKMKTPLKIAIIGVTGNAGKRITAEALNRGHEVTGIARNIDGAAAKTNLTLKVGDVNNPYPLAEMLKGHDVIVSSIKFNDFDHDQLIEAIRLSGVKRYLIVGVASFLEVAPGITGLESGKLPDFLIPIARAAQKYLDILKSADDLDWTVLAPATQFIAGERTGKFRLGGHKLIIDENGKSSISFEDYAIALVNEIEEPHHVKDIFSVGY